MPIPPSTLALIGPDFNAEVDPFVFPIYTDTDGVPESIGSAFLVQDGDAVVLITAAHVLDRLSLGQSLYYYIERLMKRAVTGIAITSKMPPSGKRTDDRIDIGVVILGNEGLPPYLAVNKRALPATRVSPQSPPRAGKKYGFYGFPASKGSVNRPAWEVLAKGYGHVGSSAPVEKYTALGLNEDSHIVLNFRQNTTVTLDGKRMNFPKPHGISGAPLWELRKPEDGGPVVVGVMIEHKKREGVVVATDIHMAMRLLIDYRGGLK